MRFLTRTHCSNGEYDAECSFAVIDIDDDTKKKILRGRELFQMVKSKDEDLISMDFYDISARYYSSYEGFEFLDEDDIDDRIFDDEILLLNPDQELPGEERTDCDRLVVDDESFYWRCYPKHTDVTIETVGVKYEELLSEDQERKFA